MAPCGPLQKGVERYLYYYYRCGESIIDNIDIIFDELKRNEIDVDKQTLSFHLNTMISPCKFWQCGDVFEGPRPLCEHGMVCCLRKVKEGQPTLRSKP
jgi:hypothetical protein